MIKMSELFCVSTDYLLKEEHDHGEGNVIYTEENTEVNYSSNEIPTRKISQMEVKTILKDIKKGESVISIGVMLCILAGLLFIDGNNLDNEFSDEKQVINFAVSVL